MSLRRVDSRDFLSSVSLHKLIIDEKARGKSELLAVRGREIDFEIRHIGGTTSVQGSNRCDSAAILLVLTVVGLLPIRIQIPTRRIRNNLVSAPVTTSSDVAGSSSSY